MSVRPSIKKAALFTAIILVGLVVFFAASRMPLAFFTKSMFAQVGINVGVLPNQYNTLDAQLSQRSAYLDERQAYLDAQQAALASTTTALNSPAENPYLSSLYIAVIGLSILVSLNFYFDWKREGKKEGKSETPPAPPAAP